MATMTIVGIVWQTMETLLGHFQPLGAGSLPELAVILLGKGVTLISSLFSKTKPLQGSKNMTNSDVSQSVAVPPNSSALSQALAKFVLDCIAAQKAGGGTLAVGSKDVEAAIGDLSPALANLSAEGTEAQAEPIGVAEAFTIAGFQVARSLTGK